MRRLVIGLGSALLLSATAALPKSASPAIMSAVVKDLASDAFAGRSPGQKGQQPTLDYLVQRLKGLGVQPGGPDGKWLQKVPMVHTRIGAGIVSITDARGRSERLNPATQINLTTVVPESRIAITAAPMVFVGYGVRAPEAKWDDFKGVDLRGKVAVFLVNDPDFEAMKGEDSFGRFGGRRMTYYGRWTYKFDEAARQGAAAALIIHDTGGAGYGWSTVSASNGENYDIVRPVSDHRVPLQGWIEHDTANRLFKQAGLDLAALRVQARQASFRPVALPLRFTADLPVAVDHIESANVIGVLPGKFRSNETVMFGAHWDAYGEGVADAKGRTIRPGANDDALGVAGVLELARLFKAQPQTDRSLVFAFWTGEERGLLGSEYYATHPIYPLATTAANLTLDILQTAGPAKDVILVGAGNSTLDGALGLAARAQGRAVTPETFSERGLFYRADHFSLAKRGVPALLLMALGGASDLTVGGRVAGQRWLDSYMSCYHKTCDTWDATWDLRGAAADVDLFHAIGTQLGHRGTWPSWSPASEFRRDRDMTASQRL